MYVAPMPLAYLAVEFVYPNSNPVYVYAEKGKIVCTCAIKDVPGPK